MRFEPARRRHFDLRQQVFAGITLIALGIALALAGQERLPFTTAWDIIAVLIALSGILHIVMARRVYSIVSSALKIAFAAWLYLCLEQRWGVSFQNSWPVLLILFGARALLRAQHTSHNNQQQGAAV